MTNVIVKTLKLNKKVIGVRIHRNRNDPIPEEMKKNNAPIVSWTLKDIQAELDKN